MRLAWIAVPLLASGLFAQQSAPPGVAASPSFAGTWVLAEAESRFSALPHAPAARMTVRRDGAKFSCLDCGPGGWVFTTDRKSTDTRTPSLRNSVAAKWAGEELVISVLVAPASAAQYSIADRWTLSRGGHRMTVTREFAGGESTLVYLREGVEAPAPPAQPRPIPVGDPPLADPETPAQAAALASALASSQQAASQQAAGLQPAQPAAQAKADEPNGGQVKAKEHILEAGARLPLRSLSAFSSKTAQQGDRVYLETAQPVTRFGRVLLPAGTQVTATIAFVQGAGKVKGRGELMLRFDSLVTPDGVSKDFRAQTTGVDATAGRVDREGRIESRGNKGGDAATAGKSTATGAIIGASAGRAGLGAAAGAAAGLARVLGTRGPDVNIRRGDLVEMALDREIRFEESDVR